MQHFAGQVPAFGSAPTATAAGAGDASDMAVDGDAAAAAAVPGDDVSKLQQQVQELQQQLQESRQVAQQWQSLHGQLHQFCTEQVLAAP
jgi:hypothetical protein